MPIARQRSLNGVQLTNVGPTVSGGVAESHFDGRMWCLTFAEGSKVTHDASNLNPGSSTSFATTTVARDKLTFYYNDTLEYEATVKVTVDASIIYTAPPGVDVQVEGDKHICTIKMDPGETQQHVTVTGGHGNISTNTGINPLGAAEAARRRERLRSKAQAGVAQDDERAPRFMNGIELKGPGPAVCGGDAEGNFDNRLWSITFQPGQKITADPTQQNASASGSIVLSVAKHKTTYWYNDSRGSEAVVRVTVDDSVKFDVPEGITIDQDGKQYICTATMGPGETQQQVIILGGHGRIGTDTAIKPLSAERLAKLRTK